jgi:hypothetical protein
VAPFGAAHDVGKHGRRPHAVEPRIARQYR